MVSLGRAASPLQRAEVPPFVPHACFRGEPRRRRCRTALPTL